jgi:hypothetical protein
MTNVQETSLERDLRGASRDGLYRALSYLERFGAPVVSAPPEMERMRAQAATGLDWLAGRDDRVRIAVDYETVLDHSSPIFKD